MSYLSAIKTQNVVLKLEAVHIKNQKLVNEFLKLESLEQLRALDLGMTIKGYCTEGTLIGVDTPEDIKKVEGALRDV